MDTSPQAKDPRRSWLGKRAIVDDQPQSSIPMTSNNRKGGDRNALMVPILEDGSRSWSFDLFDCFSDLPTCALSTCCSCYVYSRNKRRIEHLETHGVPLREPVEWCNADCCKYLLLQFHLLGWLKQAKSRSCVRRRYGIHGSRFKDFLASSCIPCELVQEHREIQLEEESSFY